MSIVSSKQVHCVWGLVCSLSSIDQERNNISLFNVVDQINLPGQFFKTSEEVKPLPFPHEIVTLWRRAIDTSIDNRELSVDVEIALVDPAEKAIQRLLMPLKFASGSRRTRSRLRTNTVSITLPGDYIYLISVVPSDGTEPQPVCRIPLEVREKK